MYSLKKKTTTTIRTLEVASYSFIAACMLMMWALVTLHILTQK